MLHLIIMWNSVIKLWRSLKRSKRIAVTVLIVLILLVGFLGYKKPLDKIEGITLKGKNSNIYVENNYGSITYDNKTLDTINKYKNTEIYQADSNKVHVTNKSILGDKIIEKSTPDFINRTPKITQTALESTFALQFYPGA